MNAAIKPQRRFARELELDIGYAALALDEARIDPNASAEFVQALKEEFWELEAAYFMTGVTEDEQ